MTASKKQPAKKAEGPEAEASVDRGPGPEAAETLVSVHDTPADDAPEEG